MPGEMKLVTASGDHTSKLWDVSQTEIKEIESFSAHTRSVKTAVFRHEDKGSLSFVSFTDNQAFMRIPSKLNSLSSIFSLSCIQNCN